MSEPVPTTAVSQAELSPDEARELTDGIRAAGEDLFRQLHAAHEGKAWRALGYPSWGAYVTAEFDFTRRNADKLVVQGRVVLELEAAAGSEARFSLSGRQAEKLAPDLGKHVRAVKRAVTTLPPDTPPERRDEILRETLDRRAAAPRIRAPRKALEPPQAPETPDQGETAPPAVPDAQEATSDVRPARWRDLLGAELAAEVAALAPADPAAWCVKAVRKAVGDAKSAARQRPARKAACQHPDGRRSVNGRCKDCGEVAGPVFRAPPPAVPARRR